jgi:hypothetical protein
MAFGEHWEWRGFGTLPRSLRQELESLPLKFPTAQEITDEYLWSPSSTVNIKLRLGDLKFKRLLESVDGLERWMENPGENHPFPLSRAVLSTLAAGLGVSLPGASPLGREELLALLRRTAPPVQTVRVTKVRWQREWPPVLPDGEEGVMVELAEVTSPERIFSVGLEHTDRGRLVQALGALRLDLHLRRLSYVQAISFWARGGRIGEM